MKRNVFVIGTALTITLALAGCSPKPVAQTSPTPRARKVDTHVNEEPVANRPYVILTPRGDGHAVILAIQDNKKKSTNVEYEIEYNAGSLVQGAFGTVDLTKTTLPTNKEVLLGSCSTGGKCTYNSDVTGGSMILRFGSPDFTLKQEWSFTEVKKGVNSFPSRDAKFVIDASKATVKASHVIVYQTPGYMGKLPSDPAIGPYTIGTNGAISGTVTVTFRLGNEITAATLMGYDGKAWKEIPSKLADKQLTATGELQQAYAVLKK